MKLLQKTKNWFLPTKENHFRPVLLSDRAISIFILLFLLAKVIFSFNLILVKQSSLFADVSAQEIFQLTNEARQQFGLPPVKENPVLNQAAQYKAEDMLKNSYFSHYSPTGISPWYWIEKAGYDYYYAGENLAMNFLDSEEVVRGWLNSPTHKDNIINPNYQEMGIAVVSGDFNNEGINKILVVQLFGSARSKAAVPIATAQEIREEKKQPTTTTTIKLFVSKPTSTEEVAAGETISASKEISEKTTPETIASKTIVGEEKNELALQPKEPIISAPLKEQQNILPQIDNTIRDQIGLVDKIIAGLMICLGLITLAGVFLQRQSIEASLSELVLRSFIIIILGASFITFHLENFIGQLMIS
ncbi:MAG: CAP domain-containing protein [Candidatus Pacebacteria bacterium]|nr:CAP domain-containing protein [Candidatus Paceibacterota bacterium]